MNQALWVAKTGLDAQQTRMSVVSNNLANVNTTGFKQGRAVFEDSAVSERYASRAARRSQDTQLPSGMNLGTGVRVVATEKLFYAGQHAQDRTTHSMSRSRAAGFFQVLLPDGNLAYSRDGTFQRNAQGEMVTASGYLVQPGITIPDGAQSITIGGDGTVVSIQLAGQPAPSQVGILETVDFHQPG